MIGSDERSGESLVRYTARALPLATIAAVVAASSVPTLWTVARGRSNFGLPLVAASFVGAVAAFAVDDPAGELTATSVVPLWRRRVVRLAVVGVPACVVWVGLFATMSVAGDAVPAWSDPIQEVVTIGAVALGLAGLAHCRDPRSAAPTGAFGAVLLVTFVSVCAFRWRWLPSLRIGDHHERWWWAIGIGLGVAVVTSRDAAARPVVRRTRHRSEPR